MANREANSPEEGITISTAVAIDRDKNSQFAVRWAVDNLRMKEKQIILVNVSTQQNLHSRSALCEYVRANSIKTLVLGASARNAISRAFRNTSADVPTSVGKSEPDYCSVYAISRGKTTKIKSAVEFSTAPSISNTTLPLDIQETSPKFHLQDSWRSYILETSSSEGNNQHKISHESNKSTSPRNSISSNEYLHTIPWASTSMEFTPYGSNYSSSENDMEFGQVTPSKRFLGIKNFALQQSVNFLNLRGRNLENLSDSLSGSSDHSESILSDVSYEVLDQPRISDASRNSTSSQTAELEEDLRRMKLELKQIIAKYNAACQEALSAREKVRDIVQWKTEEENKLAEAKYSQEAAMAIVEREKNKCKAAVEIAKRAQKIAELEKYSIEEIEAATNFFSSSDKIGEGGYGPVYRGSIDHTDVAIKILRSDISEGHKQFNREVEVLSRMRHPNMVILLGACPEYGCIVYEYMENGCLEDRLFCKNGTPPLPWRARFRIAAEIATALNFLHQTKPEPIVHRDLKPANILLDKNYISKISDVGLSMLVPPSVADTVTQYRMTAAAGTFCYIDPEYQQTGMLGTKSDIYSLGILLLQIITAKAPMGLIHQVQSAIEVGKFAEVIDRTGGEWPMEEALNFAKLALKCCELRRRDRPGLESVILPELERLRDLGSENIHEGRFHYMYSHGQSSQGSSRSSQVRIFYIK
ncbi:Serine/threonine protein kinase [Handroanthus impetiginosus]|uniref:RING-type E3 ubiquitin transferase n=1 Tax=Handroanthus impetiginosus TaxID=429701 RepID=A0A2G9HAW5_9LAMI|nr:Serine/threonine protein kinase [Handroanthus impetiginosus]